MITREELIDRAAQEYWDYEDRIWDELPPEEQREVIDSLRPVIRIALEAAAEAADSRGAATTADAIRSLIPEDGNG